jgi:hypothetical protein
VRSAVAEEEEEDDDDDDEEEEEEGLLYSVLNEIWVKCIYIYIPLADTGKSPY